MSAEVLSWRIKSVLRARMEINFTTHMFRHSAATFIADVAPQLAMLIIGVLGHADISMAEKHYIRGQQKRAFTMYQHEILAISEAAGELEF
jgi:integrase/recombinase XerD